MKLTEAEKQRRKALSEKQKQRTEEEVHPVFSPRWKHTPTKPVRVPAEFAEIVLEIARRLDNQTISEDQVREAIATKTEEIKREVLHEVKRINVATR